MRPDVLGLVLAGGLATRMQGQKALRMLRGRTLLEHALGFGGQVLQLLLHLGHLGRHVGHAGGAHPGGAELPQAGADVGGLGGGGGQQEQAGGEAVGGVHDRRPFG
ncbi:MAG: NTP transferase domain-containing protein [Planctomycetaceae bacterium]|nr:NTP transferase domain-containing protein [Planctomycetaceae bacterium]